MQFYAKAPKYESQHRWPIGFVGDRLISSYTDLDIGRVSGIHQLGESVLVNSITGIWKIDPIQNEGIE